MAVHEKRTSTSSVNLKQRESTIGVIIKELASPHPAQVLVLPILLGSYMNVRTMWKELGGSDRECCQL